MDENRHTQRDSHSTDLTHPPASSLSRRKLLSTLGAAGIALAAGDLFLPSNKAHAATSSTLFYNVKDFGARGNRRYDEDDAPYMVASFTSRQACTSSRYPCA